jgi:conjugative relaxase-like TrwC/TraI family protein
VTVSIRRMTLGSGYKYLISSVAQSDGASQKASALTRYYAESGTPPGRFLGAGLAGLNNGNGVAAGSHVAEEQLFNMLGMLSDPITGQPLGRPPRAQKASYAERVKDRINNETKDLTGAEKADRIAQIRLDERAEESKISRAVAGFDLTFSVTKSVSAAWSVADAGTQAVIYDAHLRALQYVLSYAEQQVVSSRSGKNGVVQEQVRGVVAAAFDHWDSRAGDPHLHTHVVIMNRAQSADGQWRTLDSRGVFKATVGLSEMHEAVVSDYLTEALGWGWDPSKRLHSDVPKYEVAGVPAALQREFSTRTVEINEATDELIGRFKAARGRAPSSREVLQLRQQATLQTRPDKQVQPLAQQVLRWRARAATVLGTDPVAWVHTLRDRNDLPLLRADDFADAMLRDAGAVAVYTVSEKRATFSRSNIFAEMHRQFMGVRFASADDRMAVVERAVDIALADVLLISAPELAHTPRRFTRADGTSKFRFKGFELYTTQTVLDAESRLLQAGRSTTGPIVPVGIVADVAGQNLHGKHYGLSSDQALAVEQIATSGRVLDVLVGPAGTGKSTTLGGLRAAWERRYGPGSVVGLAPSATAADVLADELAIPTENTAKWLTEAALQPARLAEIDQLRSRLHRSKSTVARAAVQNRIDTLIERIERWSIKPGQLVIVDEASLAGTFALDTLTEQAQNAGAKLLLAGDWAQLSAVSASGAFGMLVKDRDLAPELSDVRRFTNQWEKAASIQLRIGLEDVVDAYHQHDRIAGGNREQMLDRLYQAWKADTEDGKKTLMIAADHETVRELNDRARAGLAAAGAVGFDGVEVTTGSRVGVGDKVVTRENNRRLTTGSGWVKNGDLWTVTEVSEDGSVTVQRAGGRGQVVLPADYVAAHLELAYATTAHRLQGRTVDTAHAFITATTQREPLYVMATRGREANLLYVDTSYDPDTDTYHGPPIERPATDVLRQVLATEGKDKSATETIRDDWAEQTGITRGWAEYDTIARHAQAERWDTLLDNSGLTDHQAAGARESEAYGPLLASFREAEARGLDIEHALPRLVQGRSLAGADDIASVLHGRVDRWMQASGISRRTTPNRIVGLFPAVTAVTDQDMKQALAQRRTLIEQRAREVTLTAVEHRQPWARKLGLPPANPTKREAWLRQLDTIAAYRERWQINGSNVLGQANPTGLEQETQRRLAQQAVEWALQIHRDERETVVASVQSIGIEGGREGVEL